LRELRKRPEGWRTLRVGELELWWSVGEPRVTTRLPGDPGEALTQAIALTLTVVRSNGSGKKLAVTVRGRRALAVAAAGFRDVPTIAIDPGAVRRLVEHAAPRGAWPTGRGTWTAEIELPQRPVPVDLAFKPEHLVGLALVWKTA
jgi:hypothetical protein